LIRVWQRKLANIMIKRLTKTIPPLRGPNSQGLKVPLKQVKTNKQEKINGRYRQSSTQHK